MTNKKYGQVISGDNQTGTEREGSDGRKRYESEEIYMAAYITRQKGREWAKPDVGEVVT